VVPWNQSSVRSEPCFLYAAQFSKGSNGELIAAGGSGSNEAKVFNHDNGNKVLYSVKLSAKRTSIYSLFNL
jgi:hypothetical protein